MIFVNNFVPLTEQKDSNCTLDVIKKIDITPEVNQNDIKFNLETTKGYAFSTYFGLEIVTQIQTRVPKAW